MRPVLRGPTPQACPFDPYTDAKNYLLGRLGNFCSYCERMILTMLAVEHIQPKGIPAYAGLTGEWTNFLLACVNCNATKRDQDVVLADVLLPDRDNTFLAFDYHIDGSMTVAAGLDPHVASMAQALLNLTGLDKGISQIFDDNGKQIVVDRASKRMEVYDIALLAASYVAAQPGNVQLEDMVVAAAKGHGHFSIWMKVFEGNAIVRQRLVNAFGGTAASGCFHPVTLVCVSPHPNADHLVDGGKV